MINKSAQLSEAINEMLGPTVPSTADDFSMGNISTDTGLDNETYKVPVETTTDVHGKIKSIGDFAPGVNLNKTHPHGHNGLDLPGSEGETVVYPIASGTVEKITTEAAGNTVGGNSILIRHDKAVTSYYAHLHDIKVSIGDHVAQQTIIGTVGRSGNARTTSPHLHFQVSVNNVPVDPRSVFGKPIGSLAKVAQAVDFINKYAFTDEQIIAKYSRKSKFENIKSLLKNEETGRKDKVTDASHPPSQEILDQIYVSDLGTFRGFHIKEIRGGVVRDLLDVDFVLAGNPSRYGYVPDGEIWVESTLSAGDKAANLLHEYMELEFMKTKGWAYGKAHDTTNIYEEDFRLYFEKEVQTKQDIMKELNLFITKEVNGGGIKASAIFGNTVYERIIDNYLNSKVITGTEILELVKISNTVQLGKLIKQFKASFTPQTSKEEAIAQLLLIKP